VTIDSAFTFPGEIAANYRSRPELGGGALLDVGGYQAHAWLAMTGGAPQVRIDRVQRSLGATGIDLTTRVAVALEDSTRGTAVASFVMPEHQFLVVTGSDAVARMGEGAAFSTWREPSTLVVGDRVESFPAVDGYELMVAAVSDRILGESAWCVPIEESVRVAGVLAAIASFAPSTPA
jgi:predicted dehydrogenase